MPSNSVVVCPPFLGNLLFRISKMESCLDVDTLGFLVLFKCVCVCGPLKRSKTCTMRLVNCFAEQGDGEDI